MNKTHFGFVKEELGSCKDIPPIFPLVLFSFLSFLFSIFAGNTNLLGLIQNKKAERLK